MTTIIDLGKLRFYWAGAYSGATEYELNDVVRYGGNVYVYTNVVRTIGNEPTDTAYWAVMVEGINFVGAWGTGTQYFIGDAIAYGSTVYVALSDNIGQRPDINPLIWSQFVEAIQFEGVYSPTTTYQPNDVVQYGPSIYIAKATTNNNDPSNTTYWDSFVQGISAEGVYNNATAYTLGDLVAYGANLYKAKGNTTGNIPTNGAYWDLFVDTIRTRGNWATTTLYYINDVITYGGNTYICLVQNTSGTFATDLAAAKWQVFNGGVRWRNTWVASTSYLKNDIVRNVGSSYIATQDFTSGSVFSTEYDAGKWVFFAQGGDDVLPVITAGQAGYTLGVDATGAAVAWLNSSGSTYNLFVSPSGSDSNPGNTLALPKLTIQAAIAVVPPSTKTAIFVKSGTYTETLLPMVVPSNCAIIGDSLRTTIITPGAGLAADGVTPNNESTMWRLSDGSLLTKMSFQGMTGWVPGTTVTDITTSIPKGVFCALNPASPITHKSPYIVECSAFSTGGIGAYVDGSLHGSGNKSILFHEYTNVHSNGVGIWVDANARSEAVSVFTYYCYFGYATTRGGQLRSLSGNNSYGTYGNYSSGFNASEVPLTGSTYGSMITLTGPYSGLINPGDTITSNTGATATVTNAQATAIYVANITGTFSPTDTFTATSGGTGVVLTIGGQKNFILVLDGLTRAPIVGESIQVNGDSSAYIIQAVSGSWLNSASVITIVLAQEKPTASVDNTAVTIRTQFSLMRVTGHDFLNVGTGGVTTTNYPGIPTQSPVQANEVVEALPGRVYYVSTDQSGNFNIGQYFSVNQATGSATLNANAFNLSGLTELRLGSIGAQLGAQINEFSTDGTFSQNSAVKVPTQSAVVTYVTAQLLARVPQALPTSVGNVGKALVSTGAGLEFTTISANPVFTTKTANYTAVANDNLFCNTSTGPFTITLPAAPVVGDSVRIADLANTFATFNLTVANNGFRIMGVLDSLVLDVKSASVQLSYSGSTYGWRII
jgi:hypothetical protein